MNPDTRRLVRLELGRRTGQEKDRRSCMGHRLLGRKKRAPKRRQLAGDEGPRGHLGLRCDGGPKLRKLPLAGRRRRRSEPRPLRRRIRRARRICNYSMYVINWTGRCRTWPTA